MNTGDFTRQVTRRGTPAVVVVSSLLLALSGLARLAQVAAEAVEQNAYLSAHEAVGTPDGFGALPLVFLMGVALVVVLAALALLVLALVNPAGRNWTRIVTWIIGGVTLAVAGCVLALSLLPAPGGESPDRTEWDTVHAVAGQLMPAWLEPVATFSGFVASPALLVAVVLLALPSANDFYRSRPEEPAW
jgi:phosphatidylserine synthase